MFVGNGSVVGKNYCAKIDYFVKKKTARSIYVLSLSRNTFIIQMSNEFTERAFLSRGPSCRNCALREAKNFKN